MSMCTSADCKLCEFLSSKKEIETSFKFIDGSPSVTKVLNEGITDGRLIVE